jgi:hypothetical protein
MLLTSQILARLISECKPPRQNGVVEHRLVVPGLTHCVAREVQAELRRIGVRSFLATKTDPDKDRQHLLPTSLTTMRIGSLVAIAEPGTLSEIHDSLHGSGGTIRSVAFSEEWPWIPTANESFSFSHRFLPALVEIWKPSEEDRKWLLGFIARSLLDSTVSDPDRSRILFEDILGRFQPDSGPRSLSLKERFLLHCGIPKPDQGLLDPIATARNTVALIKLINSRALSEEGLRKSIHENVPTESRESNDLHKAIDDFLDGLSCVSSLGGELLALKDCWGNKDNREKNWHLLTESRLRSLFELQERPLEISSEFVPEPGVVCDSEMKSAAGFADKPFNIRIRFNIPEQSFDAGPCNLRITSRKRLLHEMQLTQPSGEVTVAVNLQDTGVPHKTRVPVKVSINVKAVERARETLAIHACGDDRAAFVVTTPRFRVENLCEHSGSELSSERRIVVDEPVRLHVFQTGSEEPTIAPLDGESLMLMDAGNVWSTASSIDVLAYADSQVALRVEAQTRGIVLALEAQDAEVGEFTIEDELRELATYARKEKVRKVLDIFSGCSSEPYRRLGGIDGKSRRRIRYAKLFEQRQGWMPILANTFLSPDAVDEACGHYARKLGQLDSFFLEGAQMSSHESELLREYEERRDEYRQIVLTAFDGCDGESLHPEYCVYPNYLSAGPENVEARERALGAYLRAYADVQSYLAANSKSLSWPSLFIFTHLDCLVHWCSDNSANSFFLVGPWHPLVTAKRYLVQQALVSRAQRLVSDPKSSFHQLISGLAQISGFFWMPSVHREHAALEPAYVSPTSDPGWHLAFSRASLEVAQGESGDRIWLRTAIESLKAVLGLDVKIHLPSSGAMVGSVLGGYARSFPSKRHLSVFFPKGFSGFDEVAAADAFLHAEEQPSQMGLQVCGGIDLSFLEQPEIPDSTKWTRPALRVFRYADRGDCIAERHPDLQFAEINDRVTFIDADEIEQIPRGSNNDSVFSSGLSRITRGQSLIPQSACEEWDVTAPAAPSGVGGWFASCCKLCCDAAGRRLAIKFSTHLPGRLDTAWTVIPGSVLDPAVFVKYVRDGCDRNLEERALWDYRVSFGRGAASYFILSTIPTAFRSAVNGLFGDNVDHASAFVTELGDAGLAIAGEAMKSGRHALGAVGMVAAVRLFLGDSMCDGPLSQTNSAIGFMLPVDSFREILQGDMKSEAGSGLPATKKRADLIAVLIGLPDEESEPLKIQSVAIECKFTLGTYPDSEVENALAQAKATSEIFRRLCQAAKTAAGMPERLALLQLVKFGLRARSGQGAEDNAGGMRSIEASIYRSILSANFDLSTVPHGACLVSSEMDLTGSAEVIDRASGLWIRLNRRNWPAINESDSMEPVRRAVAILFGIHHEISRKKLGAKTEAVADHEGPASTKSESDADKTDLAAAAQEDAKSQVGESTKPEVVSATASKQGDGISVERVRIGVDASRTSHYFDPHSPTDRLENVNMMVTGSSGKGKTQFLKYLMSAAREQSANVLVLDFKNDFVSDSYFIGATGIAASVITFDGLPFNPLIPFPVVDSRTGKSFFQCAQHIEGIAALLRRTYGGGDQQQADVKMAIRQAFSEIGVDPLSSTTQYDSSVRFPDFARVGELLGQSNRKAYNRLDPLFTLGLFKPEFAQTSFAAMVSSSLALDLSQIPSDPLKNTLAELVVLSAHSYYNSQQHCGELRQMFVVDEAHRILRADYLQRFALECRAYGLGLILSSQYPSHFPTDISASMATKVIHGNGRDLVHIKDICSLLGCVGREAEVADLGMFEAIYSNKHSRNSFLRTIAYPHYLVLKELRKKGQLTVEQIPLIAGIDTAKLSAVSIIRHLEKLGLCELRDGVVSLL